MARSRALVCAFLEAHFEHTSSLPMRSVSPGRGEARLRVRSLLLAELLSHYLGVLEERSSADEAAGDRDGSGTSDGGSAQAGWVVGLADWMGRGDRTVVAKLERLLLPEGMSASIDWELVMQRIGHGEAATGPAFWQQMVRAACLASLDKMEEAWGLFMTLVTDGCAGARGEVHMHARHLSRWPYSLPVLWCF